jgi:hypothetical protein
MARQSNLPSRSPRDEELDALLESLLQTRERLGRVGKAVGAEALAGSAELLAESARMLSREARRIDPAPWHKKLWRRITTPCG